MVLKNIPSPTPKVNLASGYFLFKAATEGAAASKSPTPPINPTNIDFGFSQVMGRPIHFLRVEEIMVYSFSVIRIRSASICYGFVRLYEKSKAKSMVLLVVRRGGIHLNCFTSKPPFFRQTLSGEVFPFR